MLPLWQRTLIVALLVAVVPVAATAFAIVQGTRDGLTDLSVANLRARSISTAAAMDTYLQNRRRDIVLVSQLPDVIAYAQNLGDAAQREAARAALAAAAAVSPAYESIAVLSLDGTIVAASIQSDEGTNVRFRDYFQNARTGSSYISDPSYSVITNQPALFFSAPVKTASGVVVGVVRSRLNLSQIWDLTESDAGSVGQGAHAFLIDDFGIRVAVSETKGARERAEALIYKPIAPIDLDTAKKLAADKRFGQKTAEQLLVDPLPELASLGPSIPAHGNAAFAFDAGGSSQRAVATRLETKPWLYVVAMPPTSYTNVLGATGLMMLGGIGLAAALGAAAALWLAGSIARPLRRMALLAEQIAIGRVNPYRATFHDLANDDLSADVARGFDRLVVTLQNVLDGGAKRR